MLLKRFSKYGNERYSVPSTVSTTLVSSIIVAQSSGDPASLRLSLQLLFLATTAGVVSLSTGFD
jgi:hypothetical protein